MTRRKKGKKYLGNEKKIKLKVMWENEENDQLKTLSMCPFWGKTRQQNDLFEKAKGILWTTGHMHISCIFTMHERLGDA